jgi:hypothetical protein
MNTDFPFPILREAVPVRTGRANAIWFPEDWYTSGVYVVYDVLSNCRYVGCGNHSGKRLRDHYLKLRDRNVKKLNARLLWDLDRLGEGISAYRFAILAECERVEQFKTEVSWIHALKANYNLKPNGSGGYYPMPEPYPTRPWVTDAEGPF